jgi:Domain of unknown function (DUF4157)
MNGARVAERHKGTARPDGRMSAANAVTTRSPRPWAVADGIGSLAHVPVLSTPGKTILAELALRSLPTAGKPLDVRTRAEMEGRLGHPLGRVRIHADATAAVTAKRFGSRAVTIDQDIVFGSEYYRPGSRDGANLLEHELIHTIEQSTGHFDRSIQCDVIDDVQAKLSYGLFDWAITDTEAMTALGMLAALPDIDLQAGVARLGPKYTSRLLDNLPDSAKSGVSYQKVVEALGTQGSTPYAKELLSYGLFDWKITDAEVGKVFNVFANLRPGQQEQFLADLHSAGKLSRLVSNANSGHHALYIRPWIRTLPKGNLDVKQRIILRVIVDETDDVLDTLIAAAEVRFDVTVGRSALAGKRKPVDWSPAHLRATYLELDLLPAAHVAKNREFQRLAQFQEPREADGSLTAGVYSGATKSLNINIESTDDIGETVRHETGHAVDAAIRWATSAEPAKPTRGGWTVYGADYARCVDNLIGDAAGGITRELTAPQRADVANEFVKGMHNRTAANLVPGVKGLAWFGSLPAPKQKATLEDRSFKAVEIGFMFKQPWFNARDGGEHLGLHVYQESYENLWVRYQHQARARKVSLYQFRDPRDWFAEAYEYYYRPDPRGIGMKLADKDPDTKAYFDTVVNVTSATR